MTLILAPAAPAACPNWLPAFCGLPTTGTAWPATPAFVGLPAGAVAEAIQVTRVEAVLVPPPAYRERNPA